MHPLLRSVTVLAILTASAQTNAEELFSSLRNEPVRWGLGIGALIEDEGYVDIGTETEAVPILLVQYKRFRLFGTQADFRLIGDEKSFLGLRADYKLDGYEESDGAIFQGMAERKAALSLGFSGKYSTRLGEFFFDLVQATSSERGMRGGVYYGYPIDLGNLTLLPRLGVEYFDANLVEYYYRVRPEEALSTRPAYKGDSTLNLDGGMDLLYTFGKRHSLLASLKYRAFGNEIQDSPLIEDSGSLRINIGYLYRF